MDHTDCWCMRVVHVCPLLLHLLSLSVKYCIQFNFHGVELLRIADFSNFHGCRVLVFDSLIRCFP